MPHLTRQQEKAMFAKRNSINPRSATTPQMVNGKNEFIPPKPNQKITLEGKRKTLGGVFFSKPKAKKKTSFVVSVFKKSDLPTRKRADRFTALRKSGLNIKDATKISRSNKETKLVLSIQRKQ